MSARRISLSFGAATYVLGRALKPWSRWRWGDLAQQADEVVTRDQPDRVLIGIGAWRNHVVVRLLSFEAICGQSVSSVEGGDISEFNCHACRRQIKRARRREEER